MFAYAYLPPAAALVSPRYISLYNYVVLTHTRSTNAVSYIVNRHVRRFFFQNVFKASVCLDCVCV